MSLRLNTQSMRWVRLGPRRILASEAFIDTKRGIGRFVTGPRSCAGAIVGLASPSKMTTTLKRESTDFIACIRFLPAHAMGFLCPAHSCATLTATKIERKRKEGHDVI